ncbi:GDSL esterase/lipase At4g01130-like [Andrographis paniculata]|uniref:GDSL esterase/lipase At4g01130-like n=1 Tax=Andrographis paniculata TaxID=175694 RepID=UPI0021E7EE00|nr:GDSL esterase/lipase At4g01130-like [Andrographis paniculata]
MADQYSSSILLLLLITIIIFMNVDAKCSFQGIFNFGDSNSDTGGFFAAFPPPLPLPFGITYFHKPTGRLSDGRLQIDFLAQALQLPFLSPYLDSIGSDYSHGVNFATSASPVLRPNGSDPIRGVTGVSPFYLDVQVKQMEEFKRRVTERYEKTLNNTTDLPGPDIFGKALYTIYIGHNDMVHRFAEVGLGGIRPYELRISSGITKAIKKLYRLGGRTFFVQNLNPMGCYAAVLVLVPHDPSDVDATGCLATLNQAIEDFNSLLKDALSKTRRELQDANIIYVDTHSIISQLFRRPKSYGFRYGIKACCGYGGGPYNFDARIFCAESAVIDGRNVTAGACCDPCDYVSWSGIHFTEAANKVIVEAILSETLFDPHFPLKKYCDVQPIG